MIGDYAPVIVTVALALARVPPFGFGVGRVACATEPTDSFSDGNWSAADDGLLYC